VQYKSNSLARHIRRGWSKYVRSELGEHIDIIPPQMLVGDQWYRGTADAIFHNLYFIDKEAPTEVLILSGDHIYKMDYRKKVHFHREREADLTVCAIEVPVEEARRMGVLEVDENWQVVGFQEKPEHPRPIPGRPDTALASMGIYVFTADVLREVVRDNERTNTSHDFGKDIIPQMIGKYAVYARSFVDENRKTVQYWRDVGTLDAYYEANMDLVQVDPFFNLYDKNWPMRTDAPVLPPAKFVFANAGERCGEALDSIVSPGVIVSGGHVERSILSPEVRINSYCSVEDAILFAGVEVGRHARIRRAVIEKNVQIPDHAEIGFDPEDDARRYKRTPSGLVVVEAADRAMVRAGVS